MNDATLSRTYTGNSGLVDAVFNSQERLAEPGLADSLHVFVGQFRMTVLFTKGVAAFTLRVPIIISPRSYEDVRRVDALSVVTAVASYTALIYRAARVKFVRNSVRPLRFAIYPNQAVAVRATLARPLPASSAGNHKLARQTPIERLSLQLMIFKLIASVGLNVVFSTEAARRYGRLAQRTLFSHPANLNHGIETVNALSIGGCHT